MAQFILKVNGAKADLFAEEEIQKKLERIQQSVLDVSGNLSFKVASTAGIKKNLTTLASRVEWHKNGMSSIRNALGSAISLYEKTEKDVCGYATGKAVQVGKLSDDSKVGTAISKAGASVGQGKGSWSAGINFEVEKSDVNDLLWSVVGKAGAVGKLVSAGGKFFTAENKGKAKPWGDLIKNGGDAVKKVHELVGKVKIAEKGKVTAEWLKGLFGIKVTEIPEGVTGGFKAGVAEELSKTTRSSVLLSLVGNACSNYDEYKSGEISSERAVWETCVETAVDVGKGILVQGLVTAGFAALSVTAAPGLVVAGAAAGVSWLADVVCKNLTGGKKVTEAVSDLILDTGEKIGKTVGNVVTTAKKKIGAAWKALKPKWLFA